MDYQEKRKEYSDNKSQLIADRVTLLAETRNLSIDWHEPDNQGVTAVVTDGRFNNAFGNGGEMKDGKFLEKTVILKDEDTGEELLRVNLCNLFSCVCYLVGKGQ